MIIPVLCPSILARGKLSDIEFLAIKEFGGKLRSAEGSVTAAGDIASLTANTGKDMYFASANVTFALEDVSNNSAVLDDVVLKINGTIIETVVSTLEAVTSKGSTSVFTYQFRNIGHKVAAGQIIKIEAITVDTDTRIEGFIECFEENTGTSPAV